MSLGKRQHLTIKSLAEDDRPREKLVTKGRHSLSDAELMAILLSSGNRNETALQLAQRILNSCGNSINNLAKLQVNDLKKFRGVGEAKAVTIAAAIELGRRRTDAQLQDLQKIKITHSRQAFDVLYPKLADLPHEEFWVLFLSRANTIIKAECISKGGVSGTVVDVRLILKPAIESLASSIILAHNHPSGNIRPSNQDTSLTKKVKEAGKLLDIHIQDHIIIGEQQYFSFADQGIL